MDSKQPPAKALSLEPVEVRAAGGDANEPSADAQSERDLRIATTDEFLAQAAKEYEQGHIDPALWRRAADQGGDASLVIACYLRTRATALQLQRKEAERAQRRARRTKSGLATGTPKAKSEPPAKVASTHRADALLRALKPRLPYLAAGTVVLVSIAVVVWLISAPRHAEPAPQPIASVAAPVPSTPLPGAREPTVGKASQDAPDTALQTQIQELKKAGNWHVFVLYAAEWTRKEPNNPMAWLELSVGYAKLLQLEDAFQAATKAVQLSPGEALLWRNLGQSNLALGRLPEAGIAFDRALNLRADDQEALCGAALVAQRQGRPSDAETILQHVNSAAGGCPASVAGSVGH